MMRVLSKPHSLIRIGELARQGGVTVQTVRYYEQLGLLSALRKGTKHRQYTEEALARLQKIKCLQGLGLSLDEVCNVIDLYFEDATGLKGKRRVVEMLRQQLAQADARIAQLREYRQDLLARIERMEDLIRGIVG